ncbi:helix-turn-helix domain-containing protein [Roseospira visakhapatnamensis]|uniref:Putative transcriptional regulator n=1 Tax=Roseospira visakhapatnamensis TaxID=390880 RepID=A0A7W6RH89_9PROT|nr:helix-turn-helix domain-containing protein [Roseospira visakhapatnamensis]MBB4267838.1 putative transcriptional regulator [Roseospira visakhapatnamensis]
MADDLPDDWDDNPEWDETNSAPLSPAGMLSVARAKLGLTQQAAADLLGISVATLRNWEQKRTAPEGPGRALIRLLYDHPEEIRDWLSAA